MFVPTYFFCCAVSDKKKSRRNCVFFVISSNISTKPFLEKANVTRVSAVFFLISNIFI